MPGKKTALILFAFLFILFVSEMALQVEARANCAAKCKARCMKSASKKTCMTMCRSCCAACDCVTPGTSGYSAKTCPCYGGIKTKAGKHKCP